MGYNVYPREVEDVLLEHPAVAEVAVVGEPSDEWGETVVAVVVPPTPASERRTPTTLLAFAAEHLAPYKRPRRVRYVDALPRNALGKVVRGRALSPLRRGRTIATVVRSAGGRLSWSSQADPSGCRSWTPPHLPDSCRPT